MDIGIIILMICVVIFLLLILAVEIYCQKEEFKKSWNNRNYISVILNTCGFILIVLGVVRNNLSFIGICVIIVANIIYVIEFVRQRKAAQGKEAGKSK